MLRVCKVSFIPSCTKQISLLVAVGMGVISDFLGLSSTTGAFAAGVLLAESGYRAQIEVSQRCFILFLVANDVSFSPLNLVL